MTKDGEIPAIFNPKRVRTPSVVVTGDSPNGPYGGFTALNTPTFPQITHSDSLTSTHPDAPDSLTGIQPTTVLSGLQSPTPTNELPVPATATTERSPRLKACKDSCCSELAQKVKFFFVFYSKLILEVISGFIM